jgi:hypothetical protein
MGRGIDGGSISLHFRIKGAKDTENDESFHMHNYRSKDQKILRKKLTDWYGNSKWSRQFTNDFENICKKYDEFVRQRDRIIMR